MLKGEDQVTAMGKNARKMVEERFNSDIHYDTLIEVYKRAIKERKQEDVC
jgi:hypothetical protein